MSLEWLTVDARKLHDSGVGVVIRNTLKNLPTSFSGCRALVRGDTGDEWFKHNLPSWKVQQCSVKPYSVAEQGAIPRALRESLLHWTPHYNIPLLASCTQITTVHDLLPLAIPKMFAGLKKQAYAKLMFQAVAWKSAEIVCVSEFTAKELVRFTSCCAAKIHVIPNGVDPSWFNIRSTPSVSEVPYFLFIGNVKPHKNLRMLLRAYSHVEKQIAERLIIVGQRQGFITADHMLTQLATSLGDRVRFTDWIEDDAVKELVANATALVFPSLYEGFGLPPLEAMAAGCPVLVSNATSLPEVCGEAAAYFDPHNIEELAEKLIVFSNLKPSERSEIAAKGRVHAARFSWERAGNQMAELFGKYL